MNMMDLLRQAQGGQGYEALGNKFGVSADQAQQVAASVLPAISSGVKAKAQSPEGLQQLAGLLRSNDAADAFDAPEANPETAQVQGSQFLEQIFGGNSGAASDAIAGNAAEKTGLDSGTIMAMLPAISAMVLGGMQKQESNDTGLSDLVGSMMNGESGAMGSILGMLGGAGGGDAASSSGGGLLGSVMGMLGGGAKAAPQAQGGAQGGSSGMDALMGMLDADGDGSVADDLVGRFLK